MAALRSRAVLVAAVVLFLGVGCGASGGKEDVSSPTTDAPATSAPDTTEVEDVPATTDDVEVDDSIDPADEEICGPLQALSDYDTESADVIARDDWTEIKAFLLDETDGVLAVYDDAIAADSEITEDLEALRAITETYSDLARASSSLEDFSQQLLAAPELEAAGDAALRVNDFSIEFCGVSTGGN